MAKMCPESSVFSSGQHFTTSHICDSQLIPSWNMYNTSCVLLMQVLIALQAKKTHCAATLPTFPSRASFLQLSVSFLFLSNFYDSVYFCVLEGAPRDYADHGLLRERGWSRSGFPDQFNLSNYLSLSHFSPIWQEVPQHLLPSSGRSRLNASRHLAFRNGRMVR